MKAKHKVKHQRLEAEVEHGLAPDIQERLARAFDLILRAAARADGQCESERKDDLRGGFNGHTNTDNGTNNSNSS